jgi:hypothetical protein
MARHPNQKSSFGYGRGLNEFNPKSKTGIDQQRRAAVTEHELKSLAVVQASRPMKPPGRNQ